MKRIILSIIAISLLFGGMSRAATGEQQHVSPFSVFDLPVIQDVYRFDDLLHDMPYVFTQIDFLLAKQRIYEHASASAEIVYVIDSDDLVSLLKTSDSFEQFIRSVRIGVVKHLLEQQYPAFITQPYSRDVDEAIVLQSWAYTLMKPIIAQDSLDVLLFSKLSWFADNFIDIKRYLSSLIFVPVTIDAQEYDSLWALYLFKTEQDLRDLWYELVSRKSRINEDRDYRRHNIMAAFHNIWTVRILMPGQIFSTLKELHYRPGQEWYPYVEWLVTVGDGATMIYWWGLCGVATALYQWSLTNLWLSVIDYSPHSTYYRNLYEAEINGVMIKDPGLDATIFSPVFDLKLQNVRDYPIIIGFSYDGQSGSNEQVFTLAKAQDKGTFEFVRSSMKWTNTCFTRKINGQLRTNCYKHVKNY